MNYGIVSMCKIPKEARKEKKIRTLQFFQSDNLYILQYVPQAMIWQNNKPLCY